MCPLQTVTDASGRSLFSSRSKPSFPFVEALRNRTSLFLLDCALSDLGNRMGLSSVDRGTSSVTYFWFYCPEGQQRTRSFDQCPKTEPRTSFQEFP